MGAFVASGHGAAAAPFKIYDEISNKLLPPEESEMMLEALMSRDDHRFIRTYVEAKPMGEVQEYGNVLQVGLTLEQMSLKLRALSCWGSTNEMMKFVKEIM